MIRLTCPYKKSHWFSQFLFFTFLYLFKRFKDILTSASCIYWWLNLQISTYSMLIRHRLGETCTFLHTGMCFQRDVVVAIFGYMTTVVQIYCCHTHLYWKKSHSGKYRALFRIFHLLIKIDEKHQAHLHVLNFKISSVV